LIIVRLWKEVQRIEQAFRELEMLETNICGQTPLPETNQGHPRLRRRGAWHPSGFCAAIQLCRTHFPKSQIQSDPVNGIGIRTCSSGRCLVVMQHHT
jgi:hypothetical protein